MIRFVSRAPGTFTLAAPVTVPDGQAPLAEHLLSGQDVCDLGDLQIVLAVRPDDAGTFWVWADGARGDADPLAVLIRIDAQGRYEPVAAARYIPALAASIAAREEAAATASDLAAERDLIKAADADVYEIEGPHGDGWAFHCSRCPSPLRSRYYADADADADDPMDAAHDRALAAAVAHYTAAHPAP